MTCTMIQQCKSERELCHFCMMNVIKIRGFMILELSQRLEKNNAAFERMTVKNSYSQKLTTSKGVLNRYIVIFTCHLFLCAVGVTFGITLSTFNIIKKEIDETRRTILYEFRNPKL